MILHTTMMSAPTTTWPPGRRGRVLLVDDDPDLRSVSYIILSEAGFSIREAASAGECLEVLKGDLPELILLDVHLPDQSGLDLCQAIKSNPATAGVAIVHLSGEHTTSEEQAEGLEAGADGYIARPISSYELTARVEATLRVKRTEAELHRMTDKLRRASRALQQIMDYSLDVICTINAAGEFVEVNAAAERSWGFSRQELIGKTYFDCVFSEDRAMTQAVTIAVMAGKATHDFENRFCCKDGSVVHLMWSAVWSPAEQMMFCVARDVTARREQDRKLRESEERFRQFADNVEDSFWIMDAESRQITYVNPAFHRLVGRPEEAIRKDSLSYLNWVHPQDRARVIQASDRSIGDFNEEFRVLLPDGTVRWHWARMFPIRDAEGRIYRICGIARDITSRKESEALIREHAALLDCAQEAIFVLNLENTVLFWNKSAEKIYGLRAADIIGQKFAALAEEAEEQHGAARQHVLAQGDWIGELTECTHDGREIIIEGHWTLVRDGDGLPKSILCINTDITERKRFESQFLRAQRMESIGTLAGGIAHDLNNVLSPIIMSIELLKLKHDDEATCEVLDTIESNAQRGADMVRQVLSFARGVEGERLLVQPKYVLKDIEKIAREIFPKDIEFTINREPDLWNVLGDATQLHQVLMNLCVNARDAMPNGGKLTITAKNAVLDETYLAMNHEAKVGPHIVIGVQDNGTGMSPTTLEKIFDPFFTTKELGRGTGLGLSTSLAIIKSHGGFIRVTSDLGKGSKFSVFIPAECEEPTAPAEASAASNFSRGNGELILVVDDELPIRMITQRTLEIFGYRCLAASDGAEAVALFVQHRTEVAAVITDMMMPEMDGPAVIPVLKRLCPGLPIIAASGLSASNGSLPKLAGLDVQMFLPKPYTTESLLSALEKVLREAK